MTRKMPPIPPANRSTPTNLNTKDPAEEAARVPEKEQVQPQRSENQGQTENVRQNTTNQGYQQAR